MPLNATKDGKPKKKKLIRVEGRGSKSGGYGFTSINFAFCSSPANGRKQASSTMTCREYVNRTAWGGATGRGDSHHSPDSDAPIDFERLRLLIVHDPSGVDAFKTKLFNGKACLNVLERINKWKPSTITTVKHSHYDHAWLLTGPKEWMSQPQLLSLATWVLRLAATKGPIQTKNFDALEANLKSLRNDNGCSDTNTYLKSFWDKLYILMHHHDEIWKGISHKKAWVDLDSTSSFGVYSGLLTFVTGNPSYSGAVKTAQSRFLSLCKKELPRKSKRR